MCSTPFSRATSMVRSVEPSSMISHSTISKPGTSRGRSASVAGSVASSLRQGIWMMSFIAGGPGRRGVQRGRRRTLAGAQYPTWRARRSPGRPRARTLLPAAAAGLRSWPVLALVALALGTLIGFLRLPDLSQLRQLLLAAVGPRAAARGQAVLRRLPHADRASARRRLRDRCSRSSAIRPTGSWSAPRWRRSSCSPPASTAWRAASFGTLVGLAAAALLCTRFDFPFLAARGLHRHPVPGLRRVGRRARGGAPAARHRRLRAAGLRRAHAPGGVAAERPVLAVVHRARHLAAARHATRSSPAPRP